MIEIFSQKDVRTVGTYGISIATELAMLGGFGKHPDKPMDSEPIKDYSELWVSVDTLLRNAYNAIPKESRDMVIADDLVHYVYNDVKYLTQFIKEFSNLEVVVYLNHFKNLDKKFPRALLRTVKTDLQKEILALMDGAKKNILKDFDGVLETDFSLPGKSAKVAILTHHPLDLLSYPNFSTLGLLESHTGTIKLRKDWHTKYSGTLDLYRIPFNQAMLQIFGDGNNMFAVMPIKLRKHVMDLAERKNWTWMTTKDKIMQNVKFERDPVFEQLMKDLFK